MPCLQLRYTSQEGEANVTSSEDHCECFCPQQTLAQGSSKAQRCACITPKGKGVLYVWKRAPHITWCPIIHEQGMKTGEATSSQSDPSQY